MKLCIPRLAAVGHGVEDAKQLVRASRHCGLLGLARGEQPLVEALDHRVEATCPIRDPAIKKMLIDLFNIQLSDNVKARVLDNELSNRYVESDPGNRIRSQEEIFEYLFKREMSEVNGQW